MTKDIKKFRLIIFFDTLDFADHNQAKANGGLCACFQDTAVYSYPPFTQLTKFNSHKIAVFAISMEKWLENIFSANIKVVKFALAM